MSSLISFLIALFSFNEPIKMLQNSEQFTEKIIARSRRNDDSPEEIQQINFFQSFLKLLSIENILSWLIQQFATEKQALQDASLEKVKQLYAACEPHVEDIAKNKLLLEKQRPNFQPADQKICDLALILSDNILDYIRELKCLSVELEPDYEEVVNAALLEIIEKSKHEKRFFGKNALLDLFKK